MMVPSSHPILLFGDGSVDFIPWLGRVLHSYDEGSLTSKFVNESTDILRNEVQKVINTEGGLSSAFNSFQEFYEHAQTEPLHPAFHAATVVFTQLATVIRTYENDVSEPFPDDISPCLGICLGELSAAVLSISKNLLHVLALAPIAVKIAFRVGMLASRTRSVIEEKCDSDESWALAIDNCCELDDQTLEAFHDEVIKNPSLRPWISFRARRTTSISGPPSTLHRLVSWLKDQDRLQPGTFTQFVPIPAPYHCPHHYSRDKISSIFDDMNISLPPECSRPLIGSSQGRYSSEAAGSEAGTPGIFQKIVESILSRPMNWQRTCDALSETVTACDIRETSIRPLGPSWVSQHLASALRSRGVEADVDESFSLKPDSHSQPKHQPLAVVGVAVRLPGATNVDEMWQALCDGKDFHQSVPKERFDPETHLDRPAFGCFIDQVGDFDAKFFNMSPREAAQTDPGHRLGLLTALEAMENAGMVMGRTPSTQSSRIGTFYGQTVDEYKEQNMTLNVDTYYIPGSLRAFAPGRLNYFFKFGGPAYAIDTACSSGAVSLNLACKSIWSGECDTVVTGGINTLCGCDNFNGLSAGRFLSSTGNCKTFDHDADGYCRAEAVCSMVVKRLDAAVADNDNILGLISSTVTNFAADAVSITRPHGPTQESLYRTALHEAGLQPSDIDYVELHGTGTQAGDQIETNAVLDVLAPEVNATPRKLFISAIKANLGHSEAASGTTSLIKALKVFQERKFPPHIGIKSEINKTLPDLDSRGVCVPRKVTEYEHSDNSPRRAIVNNFSAAGGCTAFVIEEPNTPTRARFTDPRPKQAVCLSAKTKTSLTSNIQRLDNWIDDHPESTLSDIAYTASARRAHYPLRKTFVADSLDTLQQQLKAANIESINPIPRPDVIFTFTGQGSLYEACAKDLFDTCRIFREKLLQFEAICTDFGFKSFLPLITDSSASLETASPSQSQLCIVAIEMALLGVWQKWGMPTPAAVIGHSLGEYSALYAAKVLSANDTLYLVGQRGLLLESLCTPGTHTMLAVQAPLSQVKDMIQDVETSIDVACINGPNDTVLSGASDNISHLASTLESKGIKCSKLNVPYGFHSAQVDPILEPYEQVAANVEFHEPTTPIASSMLGEIVFNQGTFSASYLRAQCRQTVKFTDALQALESQKFVDTDTVLLEVGPHALCTRMAKANLGGKITTLYSLKKGEASWASLCNAAAAAHDLGISIDWQEYHSEFEKGLSLLQLPTYGFDLKNHWIDYNGFLLNRHQPDHKEPETLEEQSLWTTSLHEMTSCESKNGVVEMSFKTDLSEENIHSAITGHLVHDSGLCPASIYGDIALTIGNFVRENYECPGSTDGMSISDMSIVKPIVVPKSKMESPMIMKVTAKAFLSQGRIEIQFALAHENDPRATCCLEYGDAAKWCTRWSRTNYLTHRSLAKLKDGLNTGTTHKFFRGMVYKLFAAVVDYDRKYQGMHEVMMDSNELEATAKLHLYDGEEGGNYYCSPFWIDAIVHIAGFVMNANETIDSAKGVYISGGWDAIRFAENIDPTKEYKVYVKMMRLSSTLVGGDVALLCGDETVGMLENLQFQLIPQQLLRRILAPSTQSSQGSTSGTSTPKQKQPVSTTSKTTAQSTSPSPQRQPSQNSEEQAGTVLKIVADEIGISHSDLTDNAEFAQLGVDSLLTLNILSNIKEKLGLDLAQTIFEEAPTVAELKKVINGFSSSSESSSSDSETPENSDTEISSSDSTGKTTPLSDDTPHENTLASARKIVAQQIGIEEDELLAQDDLSELGVDSLLAWSISAALQSELGVDISADFIAKQLSMKAIEEELVGGLSKPSEAPEVRDSTAPAPTAKQDRPESKPKQSNRAPVLLQRGSGERSLFMFPDGGGSPAAYSALPKVEPGTNIWGLSRDTTNSSPDVIENLASNWLQQIREIQPSGPYNLAGWSAGGFFSLEVARQILEQGDEVNKLILIDSPCPLDHEPMPLSLLESLFLSGVIGGDVPSSGSSGLQKLRQSFTDTISALANYRPAPLDDKRYSLPEISIIWAADGVMDALPEDSKENLQDDGSSISKFLLEKRTLKGPNGWQKLFPGKIYTATTSGHHFNIVRPPQSAELGRLIGEALDGKHDSWELC